MSGLMLENYFEKCSLMLDWIECQVYCYIFWLFFFKYFLLVVLCFVVNMGECVFFIFL